ncbi:hypothetical protein Tco_1309706 [Tanacetum coccineum]
MAAEEDADLMVVSSTEATRKAAVSEKIATKKTHSPKKSSSTPISKSADDIMTFRKELDALALKHLGPVPATCTFQYNSVNTGSDIFNTGFEEVNSGNIEANSPSADHDEEVFSDADDDEMPEIRIYDKSNEGIFEKASYDDDGIITDFNNLPDEEDTVAEQEGGERSRNCQKQSQGLVAQVHRHEEGIDYDVGLLLGFMSHNLPGFVDTDHPTKVYKVVIALYGLHQALELLRIIKKFEVFGMSMLHHSHGMVNWEEGVFENGGMNGGCGVGIGSYSGVVSGKQEMRSDYGGPLDSCCKMLVSSCLWVQNQLLDYGFNFMNTKIHIDNESTICIVKNPVYHSKTKHIEIRHHFIRDCYEKKLISVEKIHTDLNVADLLTKPFDGPRFNYLVVSIGFAEIVDFLRGSNLRYALTANPTIYDSLVKQFWQSAIASTKEDGSLEISATIDTIRYTISEASIRDSLQLDDATGITMLPNDDLFADSEDEEPEAQGRTGQADPQDSSIQGLVTPPTTKAHASGEEQEEDISPNTLEAAKTLSKVASLKVKGSIDNGRRSNTGAENINAASIKVNTVSKVNTGSIELNTVIEQDVCWVKIKDKEKESSYAHNKIGFLIKKRGGWSNIHLDALLAQRIAEEEELTEQQKKRKSQVQFEAQHYTNEDWDLIRAKLEANAELSKSMLGSELQGEDFAKKMVDLVNQRKKFFAEERAKAKRNKPMTQSQL